ncbi:serine hydrolase domain-containing protein [Cellulomonas rhizosphaerae]|uniref:Class A beta-lactamase-related serine hydrolase n=1 Tax=Cellulomonas rhizosphaerae TaxID=2293719 RepID=A0A413RLF8_9CELL|nr:serine hydrolase domain-containing protein [Cellulomonas rhizosphaerae]RHA40743.1 class A beta-lactamase-related serine hydrolase [Cellulomonas rhizosphaerae]
MDEVRRAVEAHIGGGVHGAAWLVDRAGSVTSGVAGRYGPDDEAIGPDTIFRISSVTKPVVAALAMALVEDGTLRLDEPVDGLLPELAGRRVLRSPDAALADTVPASRPITVRDVLEFRTGLGMDFAGPFPGTVLGALAELGLPVGPPAPQQAPAPDEWMRLVGSVPLSHQPGSRWLYNTSAQILGVLLARASGTPLDRLLAERVLEPLGMRDTGFVVEDLARFGPQWMPDEELYDPADGQWSTPPAFPDAAAGLVSTVADLHAFANMLRSGGFPVLRPDAVAQMTTPRVGPLDEAGREGWGLGMGVARADLPDGRHAGTYGWDGGMGSTWWTDPVTDTIAILLTTDAWSSPQPTPIFTDFWRAAFG